MNVTETILNLDAVENQLKTTFSALSSDSFTQLTEVGCCAEHDDSFQWYRKHHWQQLPDAARKNLIDPCEFSSLRPKAFHYFVPGVCLLTLETLTQFLEAKYPLCWSDLNPWVNNLLPSGRNDPTPHDGIKLFTTDEKLAVLAVIETYIQCHQALEGYSPKSGKFDPFPVARIWWGITAT